MRGWNLNEHGYWCPSCGDRVAHRDSVAQPDECRQCGYPDVAKVADYHLGPEDDDDPIEVEDYGVECGRWVNGKLGRYCSKAGSEECDWECPYR